MSGQPPVQDRKDQAVLSLLAINGQDSVIAVLPEQSWQHLAYTAFGHHAQLLWASTDLGFNGQYREPGTARYLLGNGYRTYDPCLMRFHSPDSLSPFGAGGINTYAYCSSDPVNRADPSGHDWMQKLYKFAWRALGYKNDPNRGKGPKSKALKHSGSAPKGQRRPKAKAAQSHTSNLIGEGTNRQPQSKDKPGDGGYVNKMLVPDTPDEQPASGVAVFAHEPRQLTTQVPTGTAVSALPTQSAEIRVGQDFANQPTGINPAEARVCYSFTLGSGPPDQ
ncbi:RHS repeat-associated core domain-containing protein [Pseudomonas sp. UFMG81]|uniref:RHS repeat-associated core domain-containing protein n=1 Tax=Pseudomonas sp. UFMG81 TaxID=2745936 RepID=UPI00188EB6D4|nr:RHS repeat-associated core domain-containing protein [Pseudomonas sp. UFMG81]